MAPIKKQTKREQHLEQRPWITKGILKSMKIRDSLYKKMTKKNDNPLEIRAISQKRKKYRNLIVTLLRKSKENNFKYYFEKHKQDVKKTWDGIRSILSISKKKATSIKNLNYNGRNLTKILTKQMH